MTKVKKRIKKYGQQANGTSLKNAEPAAISQYQYPQAATQGCQQEDTHTKIKDNFLARLEKAGVDLFLGQSREK